MPLRRSTLGALGLLILGGLGLVGTRVGIDRHTESTQVQTSDAQASKGAIKIGTDDFIGYFPLCSPYQRSNMRAAGYDQQCVDDKADYAARMEKLSRGDLQMAVATVDTYVLNAMKTQYPGLMLTVIDISHGADAAVSCSSKIRNIDDLKREGITYAFTPNSPSEYLIKASSANFDIPQLRGNDKSWRVEVDGSLAAAKKCAAGTVDMAVLWEPDVSNLLRNNAQAKKIIGTENTSRLIVDVLIARREFVRDHPEAIETLLRNYFKTLYYYRQNPDMAAAHAAKYAEMDPMVVGDALKGVTWVTLQQNALLWFGITEPGMPLQDGIFENIESTLRILQESGDIKGNPFPGQDMQRIVLSSFIKTLYQSGLDADKTGLANSDTPQPFSELSDEEWGRLRDVGTLRVRPVVFRNSSDELSLDARRNIDEIAKVIKSYPNFRIKVEGHTSIVGDAAVNLQLSQDRAETVARYLMVTHSIPANRLHAVGYGGTKPFAQPPDESYREYLGLLSRVVVKLQTEDY